MQDPVPSPTKPNFHYTKWKSGFARVPDNVAFFCNISPAFITCSIEATIVVLELSIISVHADQMTFRNQ